jgi:hypothetical protein
MGKGWEKSNWNSAAGCEFTVHSVVSKKVLWVSLETSFDALAVIDADADHFQEAVLGAVGIAGVIKCLGKSPGQADVLIELADGKQSGIAGELAVRWLDHERRAEKVEDLWPGGWYTSPPCLPVKRKRDRVRLWLLPVEGMHNPG